MKKSLLPILMLAALAACKKSPIETPAGSMTAEITIANGSAVTKGVTAPAQTGDFICELEDLTVVFADAAGEIILPVMTFEDAESIGLSKYRFEGLPSEVAQVAVIALRDNEIDDNIKTLDDVKSICEGDTMHLEADQLVVYGDDRNPEKEYIGDNKYLLKAHVKVVPNHSRVEVTEIECANFGTYTDIALKILGFNGFADVDAADLEGKNLTPTNPSATAGVDKVWSWNFFGDSTDALELGLGMEVFEDGYEIADSKKLLIIDTYKVGGETIEAFEAGNVYKFAIRFGADALQSGEGENVSAEVTVEIGQWIVNETEIEFAN